MNVFEETVTALAVIAADSRPLEDAENVVLRVSQAARCLLASGDDDYSRLSADEVAYLLEIRAETTA